MHLAEVLLRGDSTLSRGERELIAAYVSRGNECEYCAASHGASAAALLPGGAAQVAETLAGAGCDAPVSAKMRALLEIAALVRADGRLVSDAAVAEARAQGATDREIHDTGADRGGVLHVQPVRGRAGDGRARRPGPVRVSARTWSARLPGAQVGGQGEAGAARKPRSSDDLGGRARTARRGDLSLGCGYVAGWACASERYRRGPGGELRDHRRVDAARGRARGQGRGISRDGADRVPRGGPRAAGVVRGGLDRGGAGRGRAAERRGARRGRRGRRVPGPAGRARAADRAAGRGAA